MIELVCVLTLAVCVLALLNSLGMMVFLLLRT